MPLRRSLVEIALTTAENRRVKGITIVVGELSGVVEDSVRFCFDAVSANTMVSGAVLTFRKVPAYIRCTQCTFEFRLDDSNWACPQCGNLGGHVMQGRECYIESLEVEDGNEDQSR